MLLGALIGGLGISAGVLWVPVILLPVLLIALGLSLGLSALGVFWRDVTQVTQFASLALLFASAVFYPVAKIPPEAWAVLKFNPLLLAIDEAHKVTFWASPPNLVHVGYLYACALLSYVTGSFLFQRLRSSFADVL